MAIQLSTTLRNAILDNIEATIGVSARLQIRSGTPPANADAANTGTLLADITCPSDWMAAATGGTKTKLGTWTDAAADATGTAGHFRLYSSGGTVCFMQGTVTATGGGGDMTVDSVAFTAGQSFTVTTFTLTAANA